MSVSKENDVSRKQPLALLKCYVRGCCVLSFKNDLLRFEVLYDWVIGFLGKSYVGATLKVNLFY